MKVTMPRSPKFSLKECREAIRSIKKDGFQPSVSTIRTFLGGGSTLLISKILREEKFCLETAKILSKKISNDLLLSILVDETNFPDQNNSFSWAKSQLACGIGVYANRSEVSVAAYIREGLRGLSVMPDNAISKLDSLYIDDASIENDISREEWLRAFAYAAEHADIGEIAILLLEDWKEGQTNCTCDI
jgi:hypothetical protein